MTHQAHTAQNETSATWLRTVGAVHATVDLWVDQLTHEPANDRGGSGSLWRLSWGSVEPRTGERQIRLVRIGRNPAQLDPNFGHVWVPDVRRMDRPWLIEQATDLLGGQQVKPWKVAAPFTAPTTQSVARIRSAVGTHRRDDRHSAPIATESHPRPIQANSLLLPASRVDASPAREGWRGIARRLTGGLVRLAPGRSEAALREARTTVQRSLNGPATIVFANPKGGAGKTPATLLAAATFGFHRGGGVVAWDCNETHGTLGLRGLPDQPATFWDLLKHLDEFERVDARVGDLAAYVRGQGDAQFDVLASGEDPVNMAQVDAEACRRILAVLQRYYKIICVDTGNNMLAPNWRAVIRAADQLVICSNYEQDRAYTAASMLDHLEATGHERLVSCAVTVLSGPQPSSEARARVEGHFAARTSAVIHIPVDPAIAADTINYGDLAKPTRRAWLEACAAICNQLAIQDHGVVDRE